MNALACLLYISMYSTYQIVILHATLLESPWFFYEFELFTKKTGSAKTPTNQRTEIFPTCHSNVEFVDIPK